MRDILPVISAKSMKYLTHATRNSNGLPTQTALCGAQSHNAWRIVVNGRVDCPKCIEAVLDIRKRTRMHLSRRNRGVYAQRRLEQVFKERGLL